MKDKPHCIYAKEIARIIGKSQRTAERMLSDIRFFYNKSPWQLITIREFCEYAGLDYDEIMDKYFRRSS